MKKGIIGRIKKYFKTKKEIDAESELEELMNSTGSLSFEFKIDKKWLD